MLTLLIAAGLTFHALPDGAAEFLSPECPIVAVDCTDTPGSAEWYVPVERLRLPVAWRITRNGHTVTNSRGSTRIELAPTTGLWPNDYWNGEDVRDWYCGYDVADADYVRLPGESAPAPQYFNLASPEMFCLTWDTYIGITNYHYSALACSNAEYEVSSLYPGRELFKPQASRFDSIARSALLGSYEAYYERLYYASQGQRNEWDTDDWGETSEPWRFDFNPTNSLVATRPRFRPHYPDKDFEIFAGVAGDLLRPVPASRRLTDADNIAQFVKHVRDIFPPFVSAEALDYNESVPRPEVLDARPFVFRPHWLTDHQSYPRGDRFGARLWWASTIPPPASTQLVWSIDYSGRYVESTTLGLFPEIDRKTIDELYVDGVPFSCYATTLNMLDSGDNFLTETYDNGPCFNLFQAVAAADQNALDDSRLWNISHFWAHGMTVPGFLTNAFPRAAAFVPNRQDAFARYVDVGTDTHVTRRMVPGRLDLVNQLLSVMDRTIMIPSMHVTSTNKTHAWLHSCRYEGDESTFEAKWNGDSWVISGFKKYHYLSGTPTLTGEEGEEVVDGIRARVSDTRSVTSYGVESPVDGDDKLGVTADWLRDHLQWPSTNFVHFVAEDMGIYVMDRDDVKLGFLGPYGIQEGQPLRLSCKPWAGLERRYETSHAESARNVGIVLGPHQPGFEADGRAVACKYAALAAKVSYFGGDSRPKWRSAVDDYNPGGLANALASFGRDCRAEAIGDLTEARGAAALSDPAAYIPLPSSVRLSFDEDPTAEGTFSIDPLGTVSEVVTNVPVYHFTFASPGETVEASHTGKWVLELSRKDYDHIHHTIHTFDSNMVESVEQQSEVRGPYERWPAEPEYRDYGTVIESIMAPDPALVELVYTNSYPTNVVISGQAVTNTSFQDSFDAYDLEIWHEKEVHSYIYEFDHTRDWQEEKDLGSTPYAYPVPMDPVTSNSTTTAELTVTNSLPEDAIGQHTELIDVRAPVDVAFVVDTNGVASAWHYWMNPLTGEESWIPVELPYIVGAFTFSCILSLPEAEVNTGYIEEHAPFDESVFYRVMTQVDWLWNYMRLDKKDAQ